jgi:hypothetical protein
MRTLIFPALVILSTSAAQAVPPSTDASAGTVIRLTSAQIAAIEDAKIVRDGVEPVQVDGEAPKPPREIHGEIGFGIGTRGYSEVFGTVVTPLGDNGVAAFSFSRQSYRRHRARR